METIIYHNPRCSKSREALALLQARGEPCRVVEYLKTPPDRATLGAIVAALGCPVRDVLRGQEAAYTNLGLADAAESPLYDALGAHPELLQRPIVVRGARAVIGRPPAAILALFDEASGP